MKKESANFPFHLGIIRLNFRLFLFSFHCDVLNNCEKIWFATELVLFTL